MAVSQFPKSIILNNVCSHFSDVCRDAFHFASPRPLDSGGSRGVLHGNPTQLRAQLPASPRGHQRRHWLRRQCHLGNWDAPSAASYCCFLIKKCALSETDMDIDTDMDTDRDM